MEKLVYRLICTTQTHNELNYKNDNNKKSNETSIALMFLPNRSGAQQPNCLFSPTEIRLS